ncbi:acyl-CoA dehydrogenase family protein [Actinoplanes sp. CA-015351]|uniref:acyl-CoA dehydrogenase family protein n=1 Tax=Actinoplanes sp. CA-015351 TaxID=3239897 RepID=UPI003D97AF89
MSEEHDALRSAVRKMLAGASARSGHGTGLWQRLCTEIGVAGLTIPEQWGGSGATLLEALVVLEELGRTLTPAPMLGGLLGTQALLDSGNTNVCARLLPEVCSGERIVGVSWDGTVIDGFTDLVAVSEGSLFQVDPESRRGLPALDLTRQRSAVLSGSALSGSALSGSALSGSVAVRLGPVSADRLRDVACVALAAEQVGAASRALELTVEYAKTRVQFGRPIGAFQVLQHRMAESHVRTEAARSACWTAAEALVASAPEASHLAAVAKVWCSETFREVAAEMVQVHGGIAITWEHDAHLYLRRAWDAAQLFGSPQQHLNRVAEALLA